MVGAVIPSNPLSCAECQGLGFVILFFPLMLFPLIAWGICGGCRWYCKRYQVLREELQHEREQRAEQQLSTEFSDLAVKL